MMEKRAFLLSIGLSSLAMYLVYQYVSTKDAELSSLYARPFRKIVVAKRDILQFESLRPSDVEEASIPNSIVPPGYIDASKDAVIPPGYIENAQDVIDAVAAVPITKGEYILDNKIISKNIYSGLDTQIGIGKRAISIPVGVRSSIGFMIRPGNRVDLAAHFEYKASGSNIEEVKVFLQDLLVLAAGRTIQTATPKGVDQGILNQIERDQQREIAKDRPDVRDTLNFVKTDTQFQTVTLEVTPEQAQKIAYVVSAFGDALTLLLRNPDDRQISSTNSTNFTDVMGDDSYFVKGGKPPPTMPVLRKRYNDYLGESVVPVY